MTTSKEQREKWEDAYRELISSIKLSEYGLDGTDLVKVWLAACKYQQKEIDELKKTTSVMQNAYSHLCDEIECGEHVDLDWIKQRIEDAAHDHVVKIQQKEIDRLKKQVEIAREALEFYAAHDNWHDIRDNKNINFQTIISEDDFIYGNVGQIFCGEISRNALEKLKELD